MKDKRFFFASLGTLCLAIAFSVALQAINRSAVAEERATGSSVAESLQNEFAAVASKVNTTVVALDVTRRVERVEPPFPFLPPFPGFEDFWDFPMPPGMQPPGQQPPGRQPPRQPDREGPTVRGAGSGVIIDGQNGYILTNNHVVAEADEISVILLDGSRHTATLKGADPRTDIAVIQIDRGDLDQIEWGDSDRLEVGHWVLAFGQPQGLRYTVTAGIVSAKGRDIGIIGAPGGITGYEDFIQTDAAINPGNSGGPLTDIHGRLVGINTAIATAGAPAFMGVGFAVPSNLARPIAEQLIERGEVVRGWLGVSIGSFADIPDEEIERATGVSKDDYGVEKGVFVAGVQPEQPAERAGIRAGDVIIRYSGRDVEEVGQLRLLVADTPVGETVTVDVVRVVDGSAVERSISVEIAKQPADLDVATAAPGVVDTDVGMAVQTLTPEMAEAFDVGVESGALVSAVAEGSRAAQAGIRPGDVITQVRYRGVTTGVESARDFERAMTDIPDGEPFVVARWRGGRSMFVTIR